jgi:hypothetical protein
MESNRRIYPEASHANELCKRLQKEPFVAEFNVKLSVQGAGVYWHCIVSRDTVHAVITCFDLGAYGPQYFTEFKQKDENKALLRTHSIEETIASVSTWIQFSDIEILYQKHPIVDKSKRDLTNLHQAINNLDPAFSQKTDHQLSPYNNDICELTFSHENRSCVISATDQFQKHLVSFRVDHVQICSFRENDPKIIVQALNFWLLEQFSPIMLGRRFDGLTFSEIAIYYELGRPVIGEFIQSWKHTKQTFQFHCLHSDSLEAAQASGLLTKMCEAGYDKTLRAGQSMMTLILSRSRRHGLQKGQPCIYFDFHSNEINVCCRFPSEDVQELKLPYYSSMELLPELINVLDKLAAFPIT